MKQKYMYLVRSGGLAKTGTFKITSNENMAVPTQILSNNLFRFIQLLLAMHAFPS